MIRHCIAILVVVLSGSIRAALAQTEFRLPKADWKITLPKGWEPLDRDQLDAVNANSRAVSSEASIEGVPVSFIAGFQPKVENGCYILVQVRPSIPPGARFDSLSSAYVKAQSSSKVKSASKAMGMDPNATIYGDAPNARVISRTVSLESGPDALNCISTMNIGASHLVVVHAYGPKESFDKHDPVLSSILDSFAFDPGKVYAFGTGSVTGNTRTEDVAYGLSRMLGSAVACMLPVILVLWVVRKIRSR